MHKIDAPHATAENEFTDGDTASGIEATELWAKWFNTVQRELIAFLTASGLTPSDTNDGQVLQAVQSFLSAHANLTESAHGATSAPTAARIPLYNTNARLLSGSAPTGSNEVVRLADIGTIVKSAVLNIGAWNMNTTTELTLAHGLTFSEIISVRGHIINDAQTYKYFFSGGQTSGSNMEPYLGPADATNLRLRIISGGAYNSSSFSSTAISRGRIIVDYL
jgi:hypothetical protein